MSTATAQHEQTPATLPELNALTTRQLIGADCVLCRRRLGVHARVVGTASDHGHELPLSSCRPSCLRFDAETDTLHRLLHGLRRLPDTEPTALHLAHLAR